MSDESVIEWLQPKGYPHKVPVRLRQIKCGDRVYARIVSFPFDLFPAEEVEGLCAALQEKGFQVHDESVDH